LPATLRREETPMFDYRDLFQWERFITPSIIKIFYWLAVGISILGGIYGLFAGLFMIPFNLFAGLFYMITSVIGVLIAVLFARIISEFVLIMFRINEHLGAIRQRGQM
jgi:tetrahydromethanopterin S-methyltransferase subunit C